MDNFMNKFSVFYKYLSILCLLVNISCSSNNKKVEYVERSADEIYNSAMQFIENNKYAKASMEFEEVERQHPYSVWANRAQIMSAYVKYKLNDYEIAIGAAERYIKLHPGANDIDYAFYLIALCHYEQINDFRRDQSNTSKALTSFNNLIRRFPDSDYTRDSRLKLDLVKDHLAAREMNIGRTYQNSDNYIAAINRFKIVVDLYSKTTHAPEALARLTELYFMLGLYEQAKVYASVLGHNYPNNKWYAYSYSLFSSKKSDILSNEMDKIKNEHEEKENSILSILSDLLNIFDIKDL